jgi:hypothetical protein
MVHSSHHTKKSAEMVQTLNTLWATYENIISFRITSHLTKLQIANTLKLPGQQFDEDNI